MVAPARRMRRRTLAPRGGPSDRRFDAIARTRGVAMRSWLVQGLALATLVLAACTPTGAPAQKPQAAPAQPAPESAGQAPALARDVSVRIGHVGAPTSLYEMDAQDYA